MTGAGSGIGRATVARLAAEGAAVAAVDVRPEAAEEAAAAIGGEGTATALAGDVGDEASMAGAVAAAVSAMGGLDTVVACAGITFAAATDRLDLDAWETMLRVNLTGVFLTCQQVGRVMLAQGSGRIVTIASMSGAHIVNVPQQQVAYNASKGGLVAMTKSLAYEWASRGVRVNALSPGYVDTPLLGSKHDLHEQWKSVTPLRRFAEPAEVAAAAAWLLSDEAAFCCGTEMLMDGGYTLA